MEAKSSPLEIVYSLDALAELEEIWEWNAEHNGVHQAHAYRLFLKEQIEKLKLEPKLGGMVQDRDDLRYLLMMWSSKGYGHLAVYHLDEKARTITIAHIFHTSQNWPSKLGKRKKQ